MAVKLENKYLYSFISSEEYDEILPQIKIAHKMLHLKTGLGNDSLGWVDLPNTYDREDIKKINKAAQKIRHDSNIFIVIGIGGSYLGAKAAIEFLKSHNYNFLKKNTPKIFFIGNNISSGAISELLEMCKEKEVSINVISKSGSTIETSIAFKIFREFLENKYGKEKAKERIFVTTGKGSGILRKMADEKGYISFDIPQDIGGRYSVLTPVGLLPIAVCGANAEEILNGASAAGGDFQKNDIENNICNKYAAIRNILYKKGKQIEILVGYEPRLYGITEWFKQLFAESEGKNSKGIFPSASIFSTDLHSIGQFIQDGNKIIFETVLQIENNSLDIVIKKSKNDEDKLNFLEGKTISHINKKAFEGTVLAHTDGGVPNIILNLKNISEYTLGYMIYFFEKACAISGYTLGINPFNQPGVEAYKKNMFALLGKDGFENEKEELEKRLKNSER
ncbi:MAG: glucose-6-phosphate isomerase [Oscillospiraceae bacterium]|jgi:glucose-6-phosphate isomerase|nr:glucose-6-phosphate isomerase [Oscillospiraceae bacterium]